MRTIIELPERQVEALERLSASRKLSRAALIRHAVDRYLAENAPDAAAAFGAWKRAGRRVDGVAYQRRVRREWVA